ncbi:MAG TPA: ABC transporter ATP-binding protein [Alphaproteobacteria bacterium]|jgi:branched-chain amino acid transport system ATP-binding protein
MAEAALAPRAAAEPVLRVDSLHVAYGPIKALRGCSLSVAAGETVAVVGANGAGKTTLLRAISNLLPHQSGSISFSGASTAGTAPHELARGGLLHIPEGRGTIGRLTVAENLRIAYDIRPSDTPFEAAVERVFQRFPRIRERYEQRAGSLSGGEQQMLALARAVVNPPRLLLVDEPSLGLSPAMVAEAFLVLRQFQEDGMTILLVEQNVRRALAFADRGYVLRQGAIVMEGAGGELLSEPDMLKHYLGSA